MHSPNLLHNSYDIPDEKVTENSYLTGEESLQLAQGYVHEISKGNNFNTNHL